MSVVLFVDDSPTQRAYGQQLLSQCGMQVITANDGEQAIESALLHRPDLILMDVDMPGMGGLEACRALRKHPHTLYIPVMMLSYKDHASSRLRAKMRGATDFLVKPLSETDLHEILEKVPNLLPSN